MTKLIPIKTKGKAVEALSKLTKADPPFDAANIPIKKDILIELIEKLRKYNPKTNKIRNTRPEVLTHASEGRTNYRRQMCGYIEDVIGVYPSGPNSVPARFYNSIADLL